MNCPAAACAVSSICVILLALSSCGPDRPARYDPPAIPPLNGQLTLSVADAALAGNAPDLALHVTQAVLAKDPINADALSRQGDAYFALGQIDQAQGSYRRALALRPSLVAAELGLGRIELTRDPAAAATLFGQVIAVDPRNFAALNDLGIARDLEGRHAEAQAVYRQAMAIMPADVAAQVNLGLSLALSGNSAEAIDILRPLAIRPDATPRVRHDYAVALAIGGNIADAEQILRADMSADQAAEAIRGYRELSNVTPLPAHLNN
jgi:Flp pilus assembly protein TadD